MRVTFSETNASSPTAWNEAITLSMKKFEYLKYARNPRFVRIEIAKPIFWARVRRPANGSFCGSVPGLSAPEINSPQK